jgi:hypothetical protein
MSSYTLQMTLSTEQVAALKAMGIPMILTPTQSRPSFLEPLPASPEPKGKKGGKKAKKEKDPDAPKREPSDWIKFTSRVRSVLRAEMEGETTTNKKGETVPRVPQPKEVTQTASLLKESMASCSDADILKAFSSYQANPPAVSKAQAAKAEVKLSEPEPAPQPAPPACRYSARASSSTCFYFGVRVWGG